MASGGSSIGGDRGLANSSFSVDGMLGALQKMAEEESKRASTTKGASPALSPAKGSPAALALYRFLSTPPPGVRLADLDNKQRTAITNIAREIEMTSGSTDALKLNLNEFHGSFSGWVMAQLATGGAQVIQRPQDAFLLVPGHSNVGQGDPSSAGGSPSTRHRSGAASPLAAGMGGTRSAPPKITATLVPSEVLVGTSPQAINAVKSLRQLLDKLRPFLSTMETEISNENKTYIGLGGLNIEDSGNETAPRTERAFSFKGIRDTLRGKKKVGGGGDSLNTVLKAKNATLCALAPKLGQQEDAVFAATITPQEWATINGEAAQVHKTLVSVFSNQEALSTLRISAGTKPYNELEGLLRCALDVTQSAELAQSAESALVQEAQASQLAKMKAERQAMDAAAEATEKRMREKFPEWPEAKWVEMRTARGAFLDAVRDSFDVSVPAATFMRTQEPPMPQIQTLIKLSMERNPLFQSKVLEQVPADFAKEFLKDAAEIANLRSRPTSENMEKADEKTNKLKKDCLAKGLKFAEKFWTFVGTNAPEFPPELAEGWRAARAKIEEAGLGDDKAKKLSAFDNNIIALRLFTPWLTAEVKTNPNRLGIPQSPDGIEAQHWKASTGLISNGLLDGVNKSALANIDETMAKDLTGTYTLQHIELAEVASDAAQAAMACILELPIDPKQP